MTWFHWAVLSAIFAALMTIFAKVGLQGVDSDYATLIRTFVIILVLACFVKATGKWSNPADLSAKTWIFLVLSALATGASWICYFRALKLGKASLVAPIDKSSLLLVTVFAVAFLKERPSPREWAGILMVGAGMLVLSLGKKSDPAGPEKGSPAAPESAPVSPGSDGGTQHSGAGKP